MTAGASGAYEAVRAVIDCSRLEVVYTHVTGDELALMPNADGRLASYRPSSISGAFVPTEAFAFDTSKLGLVRLSEDVQAVEALRSRTSPAPTMS